MILVAAIVLFASVAGFLYVWVGYPLWLRVRARRWSLIALARDVTPSVTIVIPAFNSEALILRKLRNTLALEYPRKMMEVLVVSDGCTDRTEERVRSVADPRVRLLSLPRGGKLVALQQAALRARGEVLVFTDPGVTIAPGSLRAMMRNFADRYVGGVCGAVSVRRRRACDALAIGESLFARRDGALRQLQSAIGSVHGADSAFYAIRRALFIAPRNLAQADDLAISANVLLNGKRLVYEPLAVCRRDAAADGARELRRKAYVANYALRSILDLKWVLLRRRSWAFHLLSNTVGRYMTPVFMAGALVSSGILAFSAPRPMIIDFFIAQTVFYGLAVAGWKLRAAPAGRFPALALPAWFTGHSIAGFLGILGLLSGRRPVGATPRKFVRRGPTPASSTANAA